MTLKGFENGLKETFADVYELAAPQDKKRFVVWHTYGRHSHHGDNRNVLNIPKVQVDIVTNREDDFLVDDIFSALWMMGLSYSIQSEGYDPDYNAYRTILQLEVC